MSPDVSLSCLRGEKDRNPKGGVTIVEVVVGAAVATIVLACLWFLVVAVHGGSAGSSARAQYALELTEFLEVMADDLFHARYVVQEGDSGRSTLVLVVRRLDPSGNPVRELVRYSVDPEKQTLTRTPPKGPP
ncbi:MAG: hypothetical protein HY814_06220, partial [Candidatus Riflebacteria bacterium]|nr:hypothetical protein [Candidatus Riflebacteria bacterium]